MGEIAREQAPLPRMAVEMQAVSVNKERQNDDARRVEVRSMLVRLLVNLYVERNQEHLKAAA
jgi:hypothetical protein